MNEHKTVINIPWSDETTSSYGRGSGVNSEAESYTVPLIYRATRLRCNALTRIPVYVYNEKDKIVPYAFENQRPLRELLWLNEASTLLRGAAWNLKLKNRFRYGKGLQWLNPFTMNWIYSDGELLFWQQLPTGERYPTSGYWTVDDFLYLREFSPFDDLAPGTCAAEVALNDAKGSYGVSKFLSSYFPDAIPVTMIHMAANTQEEERKRVETWFKRMLGGMRNKFRERVLAVKSNEQTKIEKLTSDLNTFDFAAIDDHVIEHIAHAFEIPPPILSSKDDSYATASVKSRSFLEYTLIPRTKVYEGILNPYLESVGQRIEFAPQELPEMQEDETVRAGSLSTLVTAGIPLLAALDMLGYDLSEDAEKMIQESEKKKEEAANKPPEMTPQPTNGQAPLMQANPEVPSDTDEEEVKEPIKTDLDKWMRKSLKRLNAGKSPAVEFESDAITPELKAEILKAVENAKDEAEVRKAFSEIVERERHGS